MHQEYVTPYNSALNSFILSLIIQRSLSTMRYVLAFLYCRKHNIREPSLNCTISLPFCLEHSML